MPPLATLRRMVAGKSSRRPRSDRRVRRRLHLPDAARELAHQRFDVDGVFARGQCAEVGRTQRFFAAGDMRRARGVVIVGAGRCIATRRARLQTASHALRITRHRLLPAVGRQEPGVEQVVEAPPLVGAPAQQRLQAPAQQVGLQHTAVQRGAQGRHRIGTATAKPLARRNAGKPARRSATRVPMVPAPLLSPSPGRRKAGCAPSGGRAVAKRPAWGRSFNTLPPVAPPPRAETRPGRRAS